MTGRSAVWTAGTAVALGLIVACGGGGTHDSAGVRGAPLSHASSIAVDDSNVYWVWGDGTIQRQSKGGGALTVLGVDPCRTADSVAVDDKYVYWSHGYTGRSCPATVSRMPKQGGAGTVLATNFVFPDRGRIVVDDRAVYFIAISTDATPIDGSIRSAAKVWSVPKDGGAPVAIAGPIAGGQPATDGQNVYWLSVPGDPPSPDTPVPVTIMRTPREGGASSRLATLARNITALAFFDDRIYWVASGSHGVGLSCIDCVAPAEVQSMGGTDATPVTEVTMPAGALVHDLVIDPSALWLSLEGTRSGIGVDVPPSDDHTGSVIRILRHGGSSTALSRLPFWTDLAIDDTHIFALGDTGPVVGLK